MSHVKEIWQYSLEEILRGFSEGDAEVCCVVCGEAFEKGRVVALDGELFDAFGAVRHHVLSCHGDLAEYILGMDPGVTGLSEVVRQLLLLVLEGKSDREIAALMGIAPSTVRNHRFKLREKEKQAKMFLALMGLLERRTNNPIGSGESGAIEELHASATMVDDRYNITEQERLKTVQTYMDENGALKQFPAREKKKIIVLREIMKNFKPDTEYSEKEVNRILMRIFEEDYPSIRRALIEYGFMDRSRDCTVYRVRE